MSREVLERISHAIEDECLARANHGLLIGSFQREKTVRAKFRSKPIRPCNGSGR